MFAYRWKYFCSSRKLSLEVSLPSLKETSSPEGPLSNKTSDGPLEERWGSFPISFPFPKVPTSMFHIISDTEFLKTSNLLCHLTLIRNKIRWSLSPAPSDLSNFKYKLIKNFLWASRVTVIVLFFFVVFWFYMTRPSDKTHGMDIQRGQSVLRVDTVGYVKLHICFRGQNVTAPGIRLLHKELCMHVRTCVYVRACVWLSDLWQILQGCW